MSDEHELNELYADTPGTEQRETMSNVATMEPEAAVDEPNDAGQPCEANGATHVLETPAHTLDELEARHYAEILTLSEKVRELRILRDETKEAASAAKKRWEAASDEMDDLTARGPNPQRTLNFGDKPLAPTLDVPPPEEWRSLLISTLEIPQKAVEKLQDVGIATLGDFSDWQANHGEFWYQDIKGIGEAAATKISDAWEAFWASLPAEGAATEDARRVRLLVDLDGVGAAGDTFEIDHEEIADADQVGVFVPDATNAEKSETLILQAGEFEYVG